jgi:DNA polymerase-3 subunit epsilon
MKPQQWLATRVALVAAGALAWLLVAGTLIMLTFSDAERRVLGELVAPRLALVGLALLGGLAAVAAALNHWGWPRAAAPIRLLEQARVLVETDVRRELDTAGDAVTAGLAEVINQLTTQREALRSEMAEQVRAASRGIELERSRLAALMAELTQSVVVCNLDGRVLLYNNRARMQFRTLSSAPTLAGGSELLGLGRSIYAALDRQLIAHALESIQSRLQRGADNPSAQFVTITRSGQLLRVQMAPVREVAAAEGAGADPTALAGFVLMLDNVTREYEQDTLRDRMLHTLTEGSRGSLANLQVAVDMLGDEGLDEGMRQRFLGVVRDEVGAMSRRLQELAARSTEGVKTRWPMEDMIGTDLIAAAQRRMENQLGIRVATEDVDGALWLKLDSYSMLLALHYLAGRLVDEFETRLVHLRLQGADAQHAHLDLIWSGQALSTETVMSWETDAMRIGNESSPLSVRDVVERHSGEFWFERERVRHRALFRFLLPLAAPQEHLEAEEVSYGESRPEFYDFDLFQAASQHHALDDSRLVDLAYTVFDTETTGLNPSEGDEIIQIGATRIVGGKLRRGESFEQLVDPQRNIPAAGIPIHGITPDMVAGQPVIDTVLPAFHAYARDTVLVAHNAAFDMRFLQLKQERTGAVFDQPVLDTLLLSAVVHPNQESHRLEAIAERFDITVVGRHTALGDAMVTAEVFLRLIPLLQAMGIETLGQAREAAQKTYYARLKY